MQYVRSVAGLVSNTYNSINPATLSGAIDVIVIEQEDGSLACSPFHVRFGKFQIPRPSEKKVEFRVNGQKQNYAMKLGDGGEAFFVFETRHEIPPSMQTSPLVSPAASPDTIRPEEIPPTVQNEPTYLDLASGTERTATPDLESATGPKLRHERSNLSDMGPYGTSLIHRHENSGTWAHDTQALTPKPAQLARAASEELMPVSFEDDLRQLDETLLRSSYLIPDTLSENGSATSGGADAANKAKPAYHRAITLSKKLSTSNIRSQVTPSGDLMLDMTGYKSSEDQALRAEALARKLLSEELEGNYDIGSLIGTDENGNLWIYSSEEAKDAANRRVQQNSGLTSILSSADSDPGYHSDSDRSTSGPQPGSAHTRARSEELPNIRKSSEASHFAKTLRLTSDQLKDLSLKPGPNPISFTVNKSTCTAYMYLWRHETPIVISDIDGTITKSDVWGHLYNAIGKDWTHIGVAKLYTDIVANGYNIFYLTSRAVGQADMTRNYLDSIVQDNWKLPKGPVIMSPDRTIAALRREVYLRKPEVFKMACLRDILSLFPGRTNPFYAGFGNRLTDALSYRTVHIPSSRIFTINSKAEVSLDLLGLTSYKSSYVSMREIVDHSFPPVSTLIKEGGEEYTDFSYWRDDPSVEIDGFVPSDSEGDDDDDDGEEADDKAQYMSRASTLQRVETKMDDSFIRESVETDRDTVDVSRLRIVDSAASQDNIAESSDESETEDDDHVDEYVEKVRRNTARSSRK